MITIGQFVTHGSVTRQHNGWRIECDPHVRTKLRRVFPKVNQRVSEVIHLSDTDENCRELLWFLGRYPMKIPAANLKWLKSRAAAHVDAERSVEALLSRHVPPGIFKLAEPPREYQALAASLAMLKKGLLVADDVGVGKTVTGICPLLVPENLPAMIVVPPHLLAQWRSQLARFVPHLKVHQLKTGQPYDLCPVPKRRGKRSTKARQEPDPTEPTATFPDVILCNYHKLAGWAETLSGVIRYFLADEVQELRHEDSNKYAAASLLAAKATLRVGLSATPFFNMGGEMFNVVNILRPDALGTREEFRREWCTDDDMIKDPKAFGTHLRREGIMLRRTRKDVGRELPPFQGIPHQIACDKEALDRIKGSAIELAKIILATNQRYHGEKFRASEEFSNLMRQATGISKAPYVAEFVRMLLATEQKIVVFAWHRSVYDILMTMLADFKPRMYTGSESPNQKSAAKEAFLDPAGECRVMLISLRAGSGLDGLQKVCKVGVFAEIDYSPGVHEQCCGRYHRDGQDEPSLAYFLLADDGSDPVLADILGLKLGQIQGIRDPEADLVEEMQGSTGNVKRLAQSYLEKLGISSGEEPCYRTSTLQTAELKQQQIHHA